MVQDTWTTRKIDKLKKLWDKGLSTSEIGKKLGVSKNAVVGKAHRIGLKSRVSPIKTAKNVVKETIEKVVRSSKVDDIDLDEEEIKVMPVVHKARSSASKDLPGVAINDIKPGMCRWPSGDPRGDDFRFCGEPSHKGKPYCLHHCTVAYAIPSASQEKELSNDEANVEGQE